MCPPERLRSGVSMPKMHALYAGMNDGCALVERHGRAHRHRPYQSPSYFSTQSHTKKITIYTQSTPTKPTIHAQSIPNEINRPRIIHPNETRKQSIHTSGAEMHRALPPPLLKIKKCVYVMISASPWMTSFVLKQVILSVLP